MSNTTAQRILKVAAILLIVAVALIHLRGAPPHYGVAPYLGVGFVVNFIGALGAAVGIYRDALWGWLLGAFVFGGALVLYVLSRSVGLPGYEHAIGRWFGPLRGLFRSARGPVYGSIRSVVDYQTRIG